MIFDWLVTGQVIPVNPAHAVRGPRHSVKKGKTSVLSAEEMGLLLNSIDTSTLLGLRDRALIAVMGYTFARVSAAVALKVEDYYIQKRRGWVRLHEKGGKVNELPCHHNLECFLDEWLTASGLINEPLSPLFPSLRHGKLTGRIPLSQANVYLMIQRRAAAAGIRTKLSAHSFRAPVLPPTCRTAESSKSRNRWPDTNPPAPPACMIDAMIPWRSMKLSALHIDVLTFWGGYQKGAHYWRARSQANRPRASSSNVTVQSGAPGVPEPADYVLMSTSVLVFCFRKRFRFRRT